MDYTHLVTKEGARESLIAISNGGVVEDIACSPKAANAKSVVDVDLTTSSRSKAIDELRSELISIASFEPSTDYKV